MARKKAVVKGADAPIEEVSLTDFTTHNWMLYATETIENRALPDMFDGLKPVQRRVIYAMHKMGLSADKEAVKAARVQGNTMGSYHPHGDSSIESAIVTLVNQSTPALYGHGNWGSIQEPKNAAMRYVNCRLSDYGMTLVHPDYLAVSPMMPNYDDKELEPVVLPALLPNLFFNGASGIAVGLVTDIPPMEPTGVIRLCQKLLAHEPVTPVVAAKATRLKYRYGGELCLGDKATKREWVDFWTTGFSPVWVAPVYDTDERTRKLWITGFPADTKLDKLLDQLRDHPQVEDAEDVTDVNTAGIPCKVAVTMKRLNTFYADVDDVLSLVYARVHCKMSATQREHVSIDRVEDLAVTFHQTDPLTLLREWCRLRVELETRCLAYRMDRQRQQIRRSELLLLGCLNADLIISIIRSKNPKISNNLDAALGSKLDIPVEEAKIILDLPMRRLSNLDEQKIRATLKTQQEQLRELKAWSRNPEQKVIDDLEQALDLFA